MSNNTNLWMGNGDSRRFGMQSACVVPSHAVAGVAAIAPRAAQRDAADVRTGLTTKPKYDPGHRSWKPPIT